MKLSCTGSNRCRWNQTLSSQRRYNVLTPWPVIQKVGCGSWTAACRAASQRRPPSFKRSRIPILVACIHRVDTWNKSILASTVLPRAVHVLGETTKTCQPTKSVPTDSCSSARRHDALWNVVGVLERVRFVLLFRVAFPTAPESIVSDSTLLERGRQSLLILDYERRKRDMLSLHVLSSFKIVERTTGFSRSTRVAIPAENVLLHA